MFGLIERGRLSMYEKTFSQTLADARVDALPQRLALMPMLNWFCATTGVPLEQTMRETIEAIPSAALSLIDAHMVGSIVPPKTTDEMPSYQAITALNGLVFVRIVEVTRPNLAQRAWRYRDEVIDFYAPGYSLMINTLANAFGTTDA